jgi:hypothetical protein
VTVAVLQGFSLEEGDNLVFQPDPRLRIWYSGHYVLPYWVFFSGPPSRWQTFEEAWEEVGMIVLREHGGLCLV